MSVICSNDKGWVISHYDYSKNLYRNVLSQSGKVDLTYTENLFNIITPLMKDQEAEKMFEILCVESSCSQTVSKLKKRSSTESEVDMEVQFVQNACIELMKEARQLGYFNRMPTKGDILDNNAVSRGFINKFYEQEDDHKTFFKGGNSSDDSIVATINEKEYVLPPRCNFISCDIIDSHDKLLDKTYDFILLDPPWLNKFVKRKKRNDKKKGYDMIDNSNIAKIPVDRLLNCSGLVGIWCTNALSHEKDIKELFFSKWGLEYVSTWIWLKTTVCGDPLCSFTNKNGKKPYERILFGARADRTLRNPEKNKCIISVPSAIHSHKPPLTEILQEYLPENAECLELFARYLLPGWTSVGNQVISLQSLDLYDMLSSVKED